MQIRVYFFIVAAVKTSLCFTFVYQKSNTEVKIMGTLMFLLQLFVWKENLWFIINKALLWLWVWGEGLIQTKDRAQRTANDLTQM